MAKEYMVDFDKYIKKEQDLEKSKTISEQNKKDIKWQLVADGVLSEDR
ncbi:MAG: hypothetical protein V1837_00920 [Candidatus Woesearchaeota archaeon]